MKILSLTLALLAFTPITHAAEIGDDGLHKAPWMQDTFKDLSEDLEEARDQDKRLMVIIEQRGCIYCTRLHEDVFPDPEINALLSEKYFVVQINMFGDIEITDFDGETGTEKEMMRKWGVLFTPTIMFFPDEGAPTTPAHQAAVATMPGAFGKWTTLNLLSWVLEEGYDGDESFQKYHARKFEKQSADGTD